MLQETSSHQLLQRFFCFVFRICWMKGEVRIGQVHVRAGALAVIGQAQCGNAPAGAVLLALTDGTSALSVRVGAGGVAVDQLDRVFEGVFLDLVPVILVGGPAGASLRAGGRLADLAPTILQLMGLPQPAEMTGTSLLA